MITVRQPFQSVIVEENAEDNNFAIVLPADPNHNHRRFTIKENSIKFSIFA